MAIWQYVSYNLFLAYSRDCLQLQHWGCGGCGGGGVEGLPHVEFRLLH